MVRRNSKALARAPTRSRMSCRLGMVGFPQTTGKKRGEYMNDTQVYAESLALVQRSFLATFATIGPDGYPQMKAMIKTQATGLREFWFCSNTSSRRVGQIQANPASSLYFFDEQTFQGLMLTGRAFVSYDDAKRQEFWQDGMERYYPQGPQDPDFALIRFEAEHGNFYQSMVNWDFAVDAASCG